MTATDSRPQPARPPIPQGGMAARMQGMAGMPVEKAADFSGALRRLFVSMRPERVGVGAVLTAGVASVILAAIGPRVLGHATNLIFDGIASSSHRIDTGALASTLIFAAVLYAVSSLFAYVQAYVLAGVVQRTMQRLRRDVEDKLNRLPLSYVDSRPRGDLLSRVTNDIDNLATSMQQSMSQLVTSVMTVVAVLVMMFVTSWLLALVALVTIPVSFQMVRLVMRRSKPRFIQQWAHTGALNAQVEEIFTGHSLVKVYGQKASSEARFAAKNDELFEASFKAQFFSGVIQPGMMFLGNLNFVAIAVIGGLQVASGALSIGAVQAFIQYSRQFSQPLTQIASMVNVMQSGVASAERVFHMLDAPEQTPDQEPPAELAAPRGRIEFSHVAFSYVPDKPLITDLSLVAEPGETVAIVGPTGAGKTTLVNLVMRFYDLDAGRITLDGVDIASLRRDDLRGLIGMVLQDTWLFKGTIRDNIAYGNPDATEAQIVAAARAAYVDRFVHVLPDGYDTIVDDEGTSVSAGEKQLITIARAFLADPAILILDEATSSVDTRTEVLIQMAMARLRSDRTSFVIAHRLSTIRDADHILVMEHGDIVEQGDHESLLAAGGAYAALYQAQFSGHET